MAEGAQGGGAAGSRPGWLTWVWVAGYAGAYVPQVALSAALKDGLLPHQGAAIAGPAQLPFISLAWCLLAFAMLTGAGWARWLPARRIMGFTVRVPSAASALSGAATSVVAISILLAFTAKGSSVVTAAIVARASVLFIAASIDVLFGKRIGVHVLLGCLLALASILLSTRYNGRFALSTATAVPLAVYMVAYTVRLAAVSRKAKSPEAHKNWSFFVGEHVATAVFLVLFGFLTSATMDGGAAGAAHVQRAAAGWLALLGFSAALVSVFSGLIYVAPQNNTFCVLASRCAGVVGSTAAGLILGLCSRGARGPSTEELAAVVLTLAATALLAAGERRNRATAPTRAAAADGGATLDAPMSFAAPAQPAAPEVMSVARTASGRPAFDQRGS